MNDPDVQQIVQLATMPMGQAGEHLVQQIVNHAIAIGYSAGIHPAAIARLAANNSADVMADDIDPDTWQHICLNIATLLEKQAHEEAA